MESNILKKVDKEIRIKEADLCKYGFVNGVMETEKHIVKYLFYDVGRLIITSKKGFGADEVYIEDYFTLSRFAYLIECVTGFKIVKN